jgi:hypothetical protein
VPSAPGWAATFPYCAGWLVDLDALRAGEAVTVQYPVKAAMQWTSVCQDDGGLYFGVHDPLPMLKELTFTRAADGNSLIWRFPHLALASGQQLALPPVVVAPHGAGWRGGAALYRQWAEQHVQPPAVTDWYAGQPAWAWVGLRGQHEPTPWHDTGYLEPISETVAAAEIPLVQLSAYTETGHDTLYPDYQPGPSLGGPTGLQAAVDAIHAAGRRISIYTNGRIVDPAGSLTPAERAAWVVRPEPEGPGLQETYGSVTFDVMCPGAAGWRELFAQRLEALVRDYDVDGIYIDQVCAARAHPCYAPGHTHPHPNLAWAEYRPFLTELRRRLLSLKPELFIATEGVNDFLGRPSVPEPVRCMTSFV